jgi:hypothetical protein
MSLQRLILHFRELNGYVQAAFGLGGFALLVKLLRSLRELVNLVPELFAIPGNARAKWHVSMTNAEIARLRAQQRLRAVIRQVRESDE